MTPRQLASLNTKLIESIQTAHPGTTKAEIAVEVGCDKSRITRMGDGEAELRTGEVVSLVRAYGAVAVLGPLAAIDGCEVTQTEARANTDITTEALGINGDGAELVRLVIEAMRDGRVDFHEAPAIIETAARISRRAANVALVPGVRA